jgi:proline iminopeptidase
MRTSVGDAELYLDLEGAELVVDGDALRSRPTLVVLYGGPGFEAVRGYLVRLPA